MSHVFADQNRSNHELNDHKECLYREHTDLTGKKELRGPK